MLPRILEIRLHPVAGPSTGMATANAADTIRLNMPMPPQKGENWCWAAIAVAFQNFLSTGSQTQCDVAAEKLDHDHGCCIDDRAKPECDEPAPLEEGFDIVDVRHRVETTPLTFSEIWDEIDDGRPVACLIDFPHPRLDHFVQIDGCIDGTVKKYIVNDPAQGERIVEEDELLTDYNFAGGRWDQTYLLT